VANPILHHSLSGKQGDFNSPRSMSSKMMANTMDAKNATDIGSIH